jgi:signal transduction histidine kinase
MISSALLLAGWPVALATATAAAFLGRAHTRRRAAVAEACHELRGPLAAVSLGLALEGRKGRLPAAGLRAIELELGLAAVALDDLEAAPRRARARLDGAPVSLRALLEDSVEAWRAAAGVRGVELRLCWSGPDALVEGDQPRLAQATGNLIANAIEHGGGEVEVSGRLGRDLVRIEVSDEGPGLDAPVARLIRRGRPGDRHGHGLRITHTIAVAHGGRLAAAPSERGARLLLELPARAARAAPNVAVATWPSARLR